jgi:hypothetical protein
LNQFGSVVEAYEEKLIFRITRLKEAGDRGFRFLMLLLSFMLALTSKIKPALIGAVC